jgi:hypothetical protein
VVNDLSQHQRRSIPVLNVDVLDHGVDEMALGVGDDVALAPLIFLPAS